MVTWASRPLVSFTGAWPTSATSSEGKVSCHTPMSNLPYFDFTTLRPGPRTSEMLWNLGILRLSHLEFRRGQNPVFHPLDYLSGAVVARGRLRRSNRRATRRSTQPQVKVNMLNVCTPSAEEQKEIASALARVPKQPLFGTDFEVSRGRSTLTDMPTFLQAGTRRRMLQASPRSRAMCGSGASFPCRRFFPACNIPSATTARIWWRLWCCTCAIPRI